jgi:outer membrane lipoprotein-sorting protein
MKRLTALLTMFLGIAASGQNIVTEFANDLSAGCATFGYVYSAGGQIPLSGSGTIRLQGDAFVMKGDGLEVYCDGTTRWTVDTAAEECYIEDVKDGGAGYEANPALLVGAVDKAFTLKGTTSTTFTGQKVTKATLVPVSKDGNITELSLMLTAARKPAGLLVSTTDGNVITVTVKDFAIEPVTSVDSFKFDTKKLSRDYIITDLR